MSKGKELIGRKFGRLKVVALHSIRVFSDINRAKIWLCECECGKKATVLGSHLTGGHTKSCGCLMAEIASINAIEMNKKKPTRTNTGLSRAMGAYRQRSKKKNLIFSLSLEEFKFLTSQNCYYCNIEPSNLSKGRNGGVDYAYNGLDRMDNKEGYTSSNVLPCCAFCNMLRNQFLTVEETKIIIDKLKEIRGHNEHSFFGLRIQSIK